MDVLNRKKRSKVNEKGKIRNKLLMSFLASGVVQLTTLPIVLWFYGEVSVMGIFLNLLVLPTVGDVYKRQLYMRLKRGHKYVIDYIKERQKRIWEKSGSI